MARGCGLERACTEGRLVRAGGRGRRLARRSEVSRVDLVTVDNAVLDAPKRSFRSQRSALGKPKLESWRQLRSTWWEARPLRRVPRRREVGSPRAVNSSEEAGAVRQGWGSVSMRAHATGPLVDAPWRKPGVHSGAALGKTSRTCPREVLVEGDGRGNSSVRSTRSRTSSGCSNFSRVGCRVRGDASLRDNLRVRPAVLHGNADSAQGWREARRKWRRSPGRTASRHHVTRCVAEWAR